METRTLGKTGLIVSVLGLGGAEIGFQNIDQKTVAKLIDEALDAGLNIIDTAECYLDSEELIGNALGSKRKDVYLFTKCGHGRDYTESAWTAKEIEASVDRSLRRLKTDHIDLLQLHSCSKEILQRGEAIEAVLKAKRAGKTRFIGYSGDSEDALYAINCDVFDTLQTSVNIADQEALDLTLPLAKEKNMGVIAKRPIANAAFKYKTRPANDYSEIYWERLQKLKYDFINGDIKHAAAFALRFTLSVPGVHTAIVGTSKTGRYAENAKVLSRGLLSNEEFNSIQSRWQNIAGSEWVGQQ